MYRNRLITTNLIDSKVLSCYKDFENEIHMWWDPQPDLHRDHQYPAMMDGTCDEGMVGSTKCAHYHTWRTFLVLLPRGWALPGSVYMLPYIDAKVPLLSSSWSGFGTTSGKFNFDLLRSKNRILRGQTIIWNAHEMQVVKEIWNSLLACESVVKPWAKTEAPPHSHLPF